MIRILHVLGGLNQGGSESLIMNYYRKIDKNKYQFDFMVHSKEKQYYEKEINDLGGSIYRINKYNLINHFCYKKQWYVFLKKHKYDIIHGHMRSTASIYLKIAKKLGIKTICHSHSISNGKSLKSFIQYFMQLPIRNISDYFIGCSKIACVWLFGEKITYSPNCIILPNAINSTEFIYDEKKRKRIRDIYNIDSSTFVIGNVGRFVKAKNHSFMIKLMKNFYDSNVILLLIGNGKEEKKIYRLIKKMHLEKRIIICDNEYPISDYLSAMDSFIFPSLWEGFGISLIEAQASGLPCICSEAIPKETIITNLVQKCFLDENKWYKKLTNKNISKKENRRVYNDIIKRSQYDIINTIVILERFYSDMVKK